jgi:hypothetical protein
MSQPEPGEWAEDLGGGLHITHLGNAAPELSGFDIAVNSLQKHLETQGFMAEASCDQASRAVEKASANAAGRLAESLEPLRQSIGNLREAQYGQAGSRSERRRTKLFDQMIAKQNLNAMRNAEAARKREETREREELEREHEAAWNAGRAPAGMTPREVLSFSRADIEEATARVYPPAPPAMWEQTAAGPAADIGWRAPGQRIDWNWVSCAEYQIWGQFWPPDLEYLEELKCPTISQKISLQVSHRLRKWQN